VKGAEQLRGARMKLQRAEEHLGQLVAEHERFVRERNPYRMLPEVDPEPGYDTLWRVKIVEHPPLEKWSALVGDCVHALRSALDHTAFALVQINRRGEDYAEFPILKDKYLTNRSGALVLDESGSPKPRWHQDGPKRLPGVDRKPLAQIRWLQPYRRLRAERMHPLWLIHAMDVIDKHRRLNLVKPLVRTLHYHPIDCEIVADRVVAGPFEDGTIIAHYAAKPTGPNPNVTAEFGFDIVSGEGEPLEGEPVMQSLQGLLSYTGCVVSRFDRFFE
jgi:hypothetical protein